jgi:hypothetical protein
MLLDRFAMQRKVEAFAFDVLADAQTYYQIDDFQNDQRHHHVVDEHGGNANGLA